MTNINDQIQELLKSLNDTSVILVPVIGKEASEACTSILLWINYLRSIHQNRAAIELLNGTESALIEACAYCCLGLGRAAVAAIRTQVDLLLGYTFFRDHPVEWKTLHESGEGYRLFSKIIKYHGEIDQNFKNRLDIINKVVIPTNQELYRIMSAHIHAQSTFTIPSFSKMEDLVLDQVKIESIIKLQQETSKALSALLLAIYGKNWINLPPELYLPIRSQMTKKQISIFFK